MVLSCYGPTGTPVLWCDGPRPQELITLQGVDIAADESSAGVTATATTGAASTGRNGWGWRLRMRRLGGSHGGMVENLRVRVEL
jgi:subtilisin-like proprotein convertase family protein